MAFIPSDDGQQLDVVLLNINHAHQLSDGTSLAPHYPIVFARGGNCTGTCPTRDAGIAPIPFSDKTLSVAQDSLEAALSPAGGAWILNGSDLSIRKGSTNAADLPALVFRNNVRGMVNGVPRIIPTTVTEREDYSWLADLAQICPSCVIDSSILGSAPPSSVVARLRLRSGKVFTYTVARIGSNVTPVNFKRLDGQGGYSPYTQAVSAFMAAEIEVTGDSIELVETKFDGTAGRTMHLEPDENDEVELALLNLPPWIPPATAPRNTTPEVGKHFETYYELTEDPPSAEARLVPRAGAAPNAQEVPEVSWDAIHPQSTLWSDLLNGLRLNIGRTSYDISLCPPAGSGEP